MSATLTEGGRAVTIPMQPDGVTVITPSLPGRIRELMECTESVRAQTIPCVHLIRADVDRVGPAVIRTELLDACETEYVAFLDDDDLIDPDHLEALLDLIVRDEADLAWSWHRTAGLGAPVTPRPRSIADALRYMRQGRNVIPVTIVARTDAIRDAGAFQPMDRYEDFSLWLRMIENGCRLAYLKRETWTYRFLGQNRTWLNR